jgi:electron transport complex protein RnfC
LGGGGFALHAKLQGPITRLVINAGECEPYADADRAIMDSAPAETVAGCLLAAAVAGLSTCTLALKVTLADTRTRLLAAEAALRRHCGSALATLQLVEVPASYPSGAEQQIVRQAYNREIPAGMRASEFGIACINVSTAHALARFLLFNEPLTHRIVTVAGSAVEKPGNYRVPNGLPVADLLSEAGLRQQDLAALVHGGGMMGVRLTAADLPLTRSSYCIVAAGQLDKGLAIEKAVQEAVGNTAEALSCIRCGDCEPVCPVGLLPQQLHTAARTDNADWLLAEHLTACIECGACEAVCPSMIPLVPSFRSAKTREAERQLQRDKAVHARSRFEQRDQRLREERVEQDSKRSARRASGRRPAPRNRT